MAKQGNRQRKINRKSENHDVLGILLIVISLFLLICIVIPPVLSVVSRAIFNIVLGVFGFVAYPVLVALLTLGIFLIKRTPLDPSPKAIVCTVLLSVFGLIILQLATTHQFLRDSYVDYTASVYRVKYSAGGVIFGTIAFGLKSVLTEVGCYVIFSVGVIAVLIVMTDAIGRIRAKRAKVAPAPPTRTPVRPAFDGAAEAQRVLAVEPKPGLFIGTVVGKRPPVETESGTASDIPARTKRTVGGFGDLPVLEDVYADEETLDEDDDDNTRSAVYSKLYGNRREIYKRSAEEFSRQVDDRPPQYTEPERPQMRRIEFEPNGGYVEPYQRVNADARGTVNEPKRLDYDGMSEDFSLLSFPAAKTPEFNDEGIENVDEIAARLAAQNEARVQSDYEGRRSDSRSDFTPPPISFSETSFEPPAPVEQIIDGSSRRNMYEQLEPMDAPKIRDITAETPKTPEPEPILDILSSARTPERDTFDDDDIEDASAQSDEFSIQPQEDILDAFSSKDRYNQAVDAQAGSDDDIITGVSSYKKPEPERAAPAANEDDGIVDGSFKPVSSIIISEDPVLDLSETHDVTSDIIDGGESSGMYVSAEGEEAEAPTVKPKRASKGTAPLENQISFDTVFKEKAESVVVNQQKRRKKYNYEAPPVDLLRIYPSSEPPQETLDQKAKTLETVINGILKTQVEVKKIVPGPTVTQYELEVPMGVDIRAIAPRSINIEYELEAPGHIRIEAPIPGKRAVGIEVPNPEQGIVGLRDIIGSKEFAKAKSPLTVAIGKGITGNLVMCNLEKIPHLLIAGQTGSGKSACLNGLLVSLLYKSSPDDLRFILIDPKRVEFSKYANMPHLLFDRIVLEASEALNALKWAANEMERRYTILSKYACSQLSEYNRLPEVLDGTIDKLPHIIIVVDELADLMQSQYKADIESRIMVIAAKARAAGIHLVVATQRPSADVITGTIKTNLTSRIAFKVMSLVDSRIILDNPGAEALVGRGDMLFAPADAPSPARVQGSFIDGDEVAAVVNYIKDNYETDFDDEAAKTVFGSEDGSGAAGGEGGGNSNVDALVPRALMLAITSKNISVSVIQRRFSIGYARAARIIDYMEEKGYIGPATGNSKPRDVLITLEQYKELFGDAGDEA